MKAIKNKLFVVTLLTIILSVSALSAAEAPAPKEAQPAPAKDSLLIDLDVKDVDIKELARIFSRISGLNVVVGDDVAAKITFKGMNVEWQSALDMILKTANLTYIRDGNFLRILSYAKLRQEQEGVPLETRVVSLDFANAANVIATLGTVSSSRGRISSDAKTNSLIITDIPDTLNKMDGIIKSLDKRTPQVMIEAMMIDIKLLKEETLGINWTLTDKKDVSSRTFSQTLVDATATTINDPSSAAIRYGKVMIPHGTFTTLINLWAEDQRAEVLADPRVLTLDGLPAKIELVEEIPYTQSVVDSSTGSVTTTTSFRQAGIRMEVTPHISVGGYITLDIKTEQSFRTGTVAGSQPLIDSRKAETTLLARDGETIVIGGLKRKDATFTTTKVPFLGDIPFLGKLFRQNADTVTNTELLIFVSPVIVTSETPITAKEQESLELIKEPKDKTETMDLKKKAPYPLRPPSVTVMYKSKGSVK